MGSAAGRCQEEDEDDYGCKRVKDEKQMPRLRRHVSTKLRITPSTGLNNILQRSVMNRKLRSYVESTWVPSHDDAYFNVEGRTIALNFIDFMTEARDFTEIPKCGFQYYRACSIFEKYVMHGASNQIPLSTRVVDDCTRCLFGGTEEQEAYLFAAAMCEATDFLMAEVYPSFEKLSFRGLARKQSMDIANVMKHRVRSVMVPGSDKRIILTVLGDSVYLNAMKTYCARSDSEARGLLQAYLDLKSIENKVEHLQGEDCEIDMVSFLHWVHGFYVQYLTGSRPEETGLAAAAKEASVVNCLRLNHLEGFLHSPEYALVVEAGRNTVCIMASGDCEPTEQQGRVGQGEGSPDPALVEEMLHILRSQYDVVFGQYLDMVAQEKPLMLLFQSMCRYKDTNFTSDMDRIAECTSIFERYLSKNTADQVDLPLKITTDIVKNMFNPGETIFDAAMAWILEHLCMNRWPQFKGEVLEKGGEDSDQTETLVAGESSLHFSLEDLFQSLSKTISKDRHGGGELCKEEHGKNEDTVTSEEQIMIEEPIKKKSVVARMDGKKYTDRVRFESVMENCKCCGLFKQFLDAEGTSQTLLFLTEYEEFRKIPDYGFRQNRARKIFNKFLHHKGVMPVPVTTRTRCDIEEAIASLDIPSKIFAEAVVEVRRYIEHNQFPRFMLSEYAEKVREIIRCDDGKDKHFGDQVLHDSVSIDIDESNFSGNIMSLRGVLTRQTSIRFFTEYCVTTYVYMCIALMPNPTQALHREPFFWLDADNYANMPGSDFRKRTAIKICKKYIDENSRMQINISSSTRVQVVKELDGAGRLIFRKAQAEVYKLMESDTFPKFLESSQFARMAECFGRELSDTPND